MRHFLLICLLFLSPVLLAQNLTFSFKGTVENSDVGKNEPGVTIAIVQNGSTIATATSASNGKYNVKGNINYSKPFSVVFSKSGLVSKKVDFNFALLNEEDIPAGSEYQPLTALDMSMFAERPEVDFSFLKTEPVATFDWNQTKAVPDLDKVASEKTKAKIDKLILNAEANKTANEAKYQAAISAADKLYLEKKYEESRSKYEESLTYKPKEEHPTKRILELDALIQAKKAEELADQQANSVYNNLIKSADALRDQKKYDEAIAKYKEAIIAKDEQYPKDQIVAVEKLKKEYENEGKYKEAVTAADMFFKQGSYLAAKEKYTLANKLKPSEQHPITRLADIDKKLNEQNAEKEKKQKYDDAVAAADALFGEEKWEEAKAKYNEALTFESSATYPLSRIKDCEAKLLAIAKDKEKADKIAKLLSEGESMFNLAKWNEAKLKYNEVIVLDASNAVAKQKLEEITKKQAEANDLAAQEAKFNKLVSEGDLAAKGLKYENAKAKYEEALLMKSDPTVQTKLDDVNKKIKDLADKEALEAQFQTLKAEGLKLAAEQQWIEAKTKLTEAQNIKQDPIITAKLKEIETKIQANQALVQLEEDYKKLIAEAETKASANDLDGAIAKFKEALVKKPAEQMPKDRIKELEVLKLDSAKQKEIDAKYEAFMKKGKDFMAQKNYLGAIKEFNEALALKPSEKEPYDLAKEAERLEKDKGSEDLKNYEKIIVGINKAIDEKDFVRGKDLVERAKSYNKQFSIMPNDTRPDDLLKKILEIELADKNYAAKMKEAETFASAKEYQKAIALFEQAKVIKPVETKPQERIDELNKLIADQSSQKEKDQLYKDYMTKGALSEGAKSYEQALSHYQNALTVKENDQVAKDKISEVQQIIDDIANSAKNEIERKNQFDALIVEADKAFSVEDYMEAKAGYTKALALDGSSQYAKKQLEECETRQRLKDLSIANAEYDQLIKEANAQFDIKSYDIARDSYNKALTIRPADPHPARRLKEIDAILNPVVVSSGSLKDLGEPYDNSIMDGHAALVKADIERKNLKNAGLVNKIEAIKVAESELATLKSIEQQRTTNEIFLIQNKIGTDNQDADLNRQAIVEALRKSEEELAYLEAENQSFKHSENIQTQGIINTSIQNNQLDYGVRENVYRENSELLTSYTTDMAETLRKQYEQEAQRSINTDQQLIVIQEYIDQESTDNFEDRKATERALNIVIDKSVAMDQELSLTKNEELLINKGVIETVDILVAEKAQNDAKHAPANNEELKNIQSVVTMAENAKSEQQLLVASETNLAVDRMNTQIAIDDVARDLNRQETVETISQGNKSLEQAAFESYNAETLKYLKNKEQINTAVNQNDGISGLADEKHKGNVSSMELLDKKANTVNESIALSDEEERLRLKANVEMHTINAEESTVKSNKKQEENSAKMDDVNRAIEAGEVTKGTVQQEKNYDTQAQLNKVESKQPEKVNLANTLGQDYPEGVSQESFTQTDENGLMTAVITRRIVVIDGHGDVYVRTQTLHAITYTKNGQPATEHLWQKETTGPHLEKHF